jgi:uncharacterized repeat protein (TIGR03803 family)
LNCSSQAQTFTTLKSFGVLTNVTGFNPAAPLVQGADGTLYGTTYSGEGYVAGAVFKMNADGSGFAGLKYFTNSLEGANPVCGLTLSGSVLYGTTVRGGSSGQGTVFKVNTDGTGYTVLKNFAGSDGATPGSGLTLTGSVLYGTTVFGGTSGQGTVFKLNSDGTGYTVLKSLSAGAKDSTGRYTNSDGANPHAGLTLSSNVLYGTTYFGGTSANGTIFKLNTDGTSFTVLRALSSAATNSTGFYTNDDGMFPDAALMLSGGVLYGTAYSGGSSGWGTVFRLNTDGTSYTVLNNFSNSPDGQGPRAGLTLSGDVLYGTTYYGGSSGNGTLFELSTNGTGYAVLKSFSHSPDGSNPDAGLTLSGSVLYGTTYYGGGAGNGMVFQINLDGTGFSVLKNLGGSDGATPGAGLMLSGSALYGTTGDGGTWGNGTVFQVNTDGTGYAVLKTFSTTSPNFVTGTYTNSDGGSPQAGLTWSGSVFYGTTASGGTSGNGTVFQINTDGTGYTVLKNFSATSPNAVTASYTNSDGAGPQAGLASSGNVLYGTTRNGGTSGQGTVFKLNTVGTNYTVLKQLSLGAYDSTGFYTNSDGVNPSADLTVSGGVLYGTTYQGGSSGWGTVFKLSMDGTGFTVLKNFASDDGANPAGKLTLSGSVLYGTTERGGSLGQGTVFKLNTDGMGYTVLKNFAGSDGGGPSAGLMLSGSVLYGTTRNGGTSGWGTVFQLNTDGTGYTVLKNFAGSDGGGPSAGLMLSGSVLYGTTQSGGSLDEGTVFALDLSSTPLVIITTNGVFGFANQQFRFTLAGPASRNAVISASTDMRTWTPLATNPLVGGALNFTDTLATNFLQRFYRATLQPH